MVLFLVGVLEMIIVTAWTKVVTENKVLASGAITMVNILIWYYVLQTILDDISNWKLVTLYALGCAVGTIISTFYFNKTEKAKNGLQEQV